MNQYDFKLSLADHSSRHGSVEARSETEARELALRLYPTAIDTSVEVVLKRNVATKVKETASGTVAIGATGLAVTAGCLLQCVLSAIPVLIGLWILSFLFQSC